ncbi:hypothetical protein DEO72_LG6g2264 [Vigna unguiculata]|uniref:Uncharacterized protein n=1 Tax=Vigna unguiculata TaxID=3917 RepID=A0A4D6MCN7_VIGUN|nr:hypothetical protein DEO72_LG6g2264 [Vigna unguiculata]
MEEKKKLVEARCDGGRAQRWWSMALGREEEAMEVQERRPKETQDRRRSLKNEKDFRNL